MQAYSKHNCGYHFRQNLFLVTLVITSNKQELSYTVLLFLYFCSSASEENGREKEKGRRALQILGVYQIAGFRCIVAMNRTKY
jgi:hypothetical protein